MSSVAELEEEQQRIGEEMLILYDQRPPNLPHRKMQEAAMAKYKAGQNRYDVLWKRFREIQRLLGRDPGAIVKRWSVTKGNIDEKIS